MKTLNIIASALIMILPFLLSCNKVVYDDLFNPVCTLLYDDNDSNTGSVPAEPVVYKPGDVITVPDNTGILQKTDFSFIGWNTASDGSGTTYTAGQKLTMGSKTVILYALWSATITFDANGGTGTIAPQDIYYNGSKTLRPNTFARANYIFSGWALSSASASADYNDESSYHMVNGNVTLYAVWSPDTYSLTFNANGATSGTMAPQSIAYGTAEDISPNLFAKTGYTFAGWSTVSGGTAAYIDGQSYTMTTAGAILYAVWQGTITYDANTGTGSMSSQIIYFGIPVLLTPNSFTKAGYSFAGWNTSADNSGNPFADGASYNLDLGSRTLYAQWTRTIHHITTDAQLNAMRGGIIAGWTSADYYILDVDIDLSVNYSGGWTPIGTSAAPFTGELHAGNHTISNLKITGSGNNQGLFGYLSDATVQDLNITGVTVNAAGYDYIGALAGYSDTSTISNCSVAGTLVSGDACVGGMVGYNTGTITSCSGEVPVTATDTDTGGLVGTNTGEVTYSYTTSSAPVQGRLYIGGLIGVNSSTATVNHCYALNSVTGVSNPYDTGGLIGRNFADVTMCYAAGNVSGWTNAGGLIGLNYTGTSVTYCFSKGSVAGSLGSIRIGGLIGELQTGCIVDYSYSTGVVTSTGSNGGLIGELNGSSCTVTDSYFNSVNTNNTYGIPASLANMQNQATYTGWDFAAMWAISGTINGGYPYLQELVP